MKRKDLATSVNRNESIKILKGLPLVQAERNLKKLELIDEQITEVEKLLDKELESDKNVETLIVDTCCVVACKIKWRRCAKG